MIDVVFLLLVFFLSTSSFQKLEKNLPGAVSTAPEAKQQGNQETQEPPIGQSDLSDVVITIKRAQNQSLEYKLNEEPIASLNSLSQRLAAILKVRTDVPIIVQPDDIVPAGEAIRIYDLARSKGAIAVFLVAR